MAVILRHEKHGDIHFKDGTTDEELANYLVQLEAIEGEQYGALETLGTQFGRSLTSSIRGIKKLTGLEDPHEDYMDRQQEFESRVMFEQRPATSIVGMLGGGIADPVSLPAVALKPLTFGSKAATYGSRGVAHGLFGGAVEPVYEEYGDSMVFNVLGSAALGGLFGGGIGKLVDRGAKSSDEIQKTATNTEEVSDRALSGLIKELDEPVRTPEQAIAKIREETEKVAAGALPQRAVDDLNNQAKLLDNDIKRNEQSMVNLEKARAGTKNSSRRNAIKYRLDQLAGEQVVLRDNLNNIHTKMAEAETARQAVDTLKKIDKGQFTRIDGFQEQLQQQLAIPRTPIAEGVRIAQGQPSPTPQLKPTVAKKLGLAEQLGVGTPFPTVHRSVGSAAGTKERIVGEEFLPRTAGDTNATRKLVEGKFKGRNPETRVNVKPSRKTVEAQQDFDAKYDAGKVTEDDWKKLDAAESEMDELKGYKEFLQKLAGSRALDTAAMRGFMKGRHTFDNIEASAAAQLKKLGIEDIEDMVDFVLESEGRLLDAHEMAMLTPVFKQVEQKLFRIHKLLEHSSDLDDADIALIHNDINMYYGLQAWFKGQGSRASAALNYRRKMLQDIAEDRMIDSLFLGIKC